MATKKPTKKDPYKEAEALLEQKKQEIANQAMNKLNKSIQDIQKEFGVVIQYETIIKIIKN